MSLRNKYYGRIYVKGVAQPQPVSIDARNPTEAKKLIEAQWGASFKRWANHPRKDRPFS